MPVNGLELPKALEVTMDSLLSNLELKSWQIFSENEGAVLKIRFKPASHIGDTCSTVKPHISSKFKKISPSQLKRDKERSTRHSMMTRSKDSKEQARGEQELDNLALDISAMSVESVNNSGSTCSNILDLNNSVIEPRQVVNIISPQLQTSNQPVGEAILSPVPSVTEQSDSDNDDSDSCSASDTDVPPNTENLCSASHCHYGDKNGDPNIPVYKCLACSSEDNIREGLSSGPLFICNNCREAGGHKNHNRYITFGIKKFSDWQ